MTSRIQGHNLKFQNLEIPVEVYKLANFDAKDKNQSFFFTYLKYNRKKITFYDLANTDHDLKFRWRKYEVPNIFKNLDFISFFFHFWMHVAFGSKCFEKKHHSVLCLLLPWMHKARRTNWFLRRESGLIELVSKRCEHVQYRVEKIGEKNTNLHVATFQRVDTFHYTFLGRTRVRNPEHFENAMVNIKFIPQDTASTVLLRFLTICWIIIKSMKIFDRFSKFASVRPAIKFFVTKNQDSRKKLRKYENWGNFFFLLSSKDANSDLMFLLQLLFSVTSDNISFDWLLFKFFSNIPIAWSGIIFVFVLLHQAKFQYRNHGVDWIFRVCVTRVHWKLRMRHKLFVGWRKIIILLFC